MEFTDKILSSPTVVKLMGEMSEANREVAIKNFREILKPFEKIYDDINLQKSDEEGKMKFEDSFIDLLIKLGEENG